MTRIEKAVKRVSDPYDFYRQIPLISGKGLLQKRMPGSSESLLPRPRQEEKHQGQGRK